jgi:hypothetical protein
MPRKRYKPEEIVAKLRQVDVPVSQGQSTSDSPICGQLSDKPQLDFALHMGCRARSAIEIRN